MISVNSRKMVVLIFLASVGFNPAAGTSRYRTIVVEHGGSVRGSVRLHSGYSRQLSDPVTKDEAVCGKRKPSPRLRTGKDDVVSNAVVWIDQIAQGKRCDPPGVATLRQRNCEYEPHVLLLKPNDELEIVNEDPILHNVHTYNLGKEMCSVFNIAQPVRGFHTHIRAGSLEGVDAMMTTCDAGHPWMSAYVIRASNPYYTVTDASGCFLLENVPAGKYVLKMWHEGVMAAASRGGPGTAPVVEESYTESQEITVRADGSSSVDFVISLRPGS